MLKIENLSIIRDNNLLLDDISIEIEAKKRIGICGISGIGKSSLLRCIQGLDPCEGKITKPSSVLVMQELGLFPHMNVLQNLTYPVRHMTNIQADVEYWLKYFDLYQHRNVFPGSLSGGQKQKVALSRAFLFRSPLLLMDEPTSALDLDSISKVSAAIRNISNTVVIASHDIGFLSFICDDVFEVIEKKLSRIE